ncbi:N-acetylmuramoyl-L-alanine amidase [Deinococcus sp.]|uniref:N-acetylmuramoyl-L-alanine amidase n=1 Tax=Deinococcus sp. TaxID=47478 RepID=UPI00391C1D49
MSIEQRPAHPGNFTKGRAARIDRVVIHVADGTYGGTLSWFAQDAAPASAHYTVATDGRTGQSVQEGDTAWHAGDWTMNARSVGVEHEGMPSRGPWAPSAAQLRASAELVAGICRRHGIPVDRAHIIGHSDVNPDRKARQGCPGPTWPWEAYLDMVCEILTPAPQPGHVKDGQEQRPVRLFDPETNTQIGEGTLIAGTDKVYVKVKK